MAQPVSATSSCVMGSFSPAATRIICSTRSTPVISSVTGVFHLKARVHLEEIEVPVPVDV